MFEDAKEKVMTMYEGYYDEYRDFLAGDMRDAASDIIEKLMVLEDVLKSAFGMSDEDFEKFEDELIHKYSKKNYGW